MTADNDNTTSTGEQGSAAKSRKRGAASRSRSAKKASPRKSAGRAASAKRGRSAAASASEGNQAGASAAKRGRSAGRKAGASARKQQQSSGTASGSGLTGAAGRLMSRGRRAASGAFDWASEGASRAMPLARSAMPDQRLVQRLVDERPYMLGAIGLGIGAMIGMMLPNPFNGAASHSSGRGGSGRSGGSSSASGRGRSGRG